MSNDGRDRRSPEIATRIPARLIDSAGKEVAVIVTGLSSSTFRLETTGLLEPGERVILRVDRDRDYPAQIGWSTRGESAGRFLEPVKLVNGVPQ